jgi:hypothetical protein
MERGHTPTEAALLRFVIKLRYFAEYWHHLLLIKQMAELKRVLRLSNTKDGQRP